MNKSNFNTEISPKVVQGRTWGSPRDRNRPMSDNQKQRVTDLISKTLPHLPHKMCSTNERNTMNFASSLRTDFNLGGQSKLPVLPVNRNCDSVPMERGHAAGDLGSSGIPRESTASRKLKIRGLKTFISKHGSGVSPGWVKEFPCRSRFHPDLYLYNFDEGPLNPKRNTEALGQCHYKGGRCKKCGIYAQSICPQCDYCDTDCKCVDSSNVTSNSSNPNEILTNPFTGLPTMDSFATTLSTAQKFLTNSHNVPNQYPFKPVIAPNRPSQGQVPSNVASTPLTHQQPLFAPPTYPSYLPSYPYGYPPLPYLIPPPPPVYGYAYPPPPMPMPLPYPTSLPMMPFPPTFQSPMYTYPCTQNQVPVPPYCSQEIQAQQPAPPPPKCNTVISVNSNDPL